MRNPIVTSSRMPWLAVLVLALVASPAAAQTEATQLEPAGAKENVWSKGVSEQERQAADGLFKEGNRLLRESISVSAAAKYREALTHWDHPNIHYNLALALMSLDQPLETHEHLQAAMKYGPAPLGPDRFEHARNYQSLLDKQLTRVKVRCDVPGAKVELDGKPLFDPPGEHEELVRAGRHTLVASKAGLVTNSVARSFDGGQTTTVDLKLESLEQMTDYRRRWPAWKPWAVVGAGAGVVLAGVALQYGGLQKVAAVDEASKTQCPTGCASEPAALASDRQTGVRMQQAAIGAYAIGAAAVATGAVLVFMNRGERYVRTYDAGAPDAAPPPPAPPRASLDVAPMIDGERRGLIATLRY
jgi:hypothetical protein